MSGGNLIGGGNMKVAMRLLMGGAVGRNGPGA